MKLNGTHQLLVYADYVNTLGGNVCIIHKSSEVLVVTTREIGIEVNADKTMYIVTFRDQNEGLSHNIKIDNSFLARVEEFKYLGTT